MSDKPGKNPDAWLEDESTVSRAYRELRQAGPPPQLDEEILAEARRAVDKPDKVVIRVQRWRKWTMPAALAATVVFAVPLVVRVFDTMSPDLEANRGPTMSDKTTMETGLAEADRDLSALSPATPAAISTDGRAGQQAVPPAAAPSPATSLVPPIERTDGDAFAAEQQRAQTRKAESLAAAMDRPSTDNGKSGRTPALAESAEVSSTEVFAAPPGPEAGQAESFIDDASGSAQASAPAMAPEQRLADLQVVIAESDREKESRFGRQQAADVAQDEIHYRTARPAAASASLEMAAVGDENRLGSAGMREPQQWLSDIADQHRRGLVRTARRALGSFLQTYPDHALPDDYPLRAEDALYDDETASEPGDIVPEAASWLRGIGLMAERGDIDQARTQLAEFFKIYPDYPLPENFPLTRDDGQPIER